MIPFPEEPWYQHVSRSLDRVGRKLIDQKLLAGLIATVAVLAMLTGCAAGKANRSGLPWASGVYTWDPTPAGVSSFAAWRGRAVDVVDAWSARATWADIVDPAWLYQRWTGKPYTIAFGVPMLPEHVPGVSIQACAKGLYNSHWRQFGRVISSYRLGHSIIRLGWEFNGGWYVWQARDPSSWAECWRQIVNSARSTAPSLQWDWNVSRGASQGSPEPVRAYPGNSYVSIIGVDSFDNWPGASTSAGWWVQLNGTQGLKYWLNFAREHGKKLSVPEWGNVRSRSGSGGGDDPGYVRLMYEFFNSNADDIAFECNFQGASSSTGGSYGPGTLVPMAAKAYKTAF